MHKLILSIA